MVVELNPVAGLQEYVLPETLAVPMIAEVVVQVNVTSGPAFAVGAVLLTVTVTELVAVHPLDPVTVTV